MITVHDFGEVRPGKIRLLVGQPSSDIVEWQATDDLFFQVNDEKVRQWLASLRATARQQTVDFVVLPELAVPLTLLPEIQTWSSQTGITVVAGSHYFRSSTGWVSRCPVVVRGEVLFTEKRVPSPHEVSPVKGKGLQAGAQTTFFRNSPVGDFAVLICSDFLDQRVRAAALAHAPDLVVVPSFQSHSRTYHERMQVEADDADEGLYLVYSNHVCDGHSDGHSAVFGVMDHLFHDKMISAGHTDGTHRAKALDLGSAAGFAVVELDLSVRRPRLPRTVHSRPNIALVERGRVTMSREAVFTSKIAHDDDRYRRIDSLFVEPAEYDDIREKLEARRLVFIIGDPGIGKTYTAVKLLKQYFERGYEPVWFTGLEKEERVVQRQTLENFTPRDHEVIYFEDPFGRTVFERRDAIYQVFGPLSDRVRDVDARVIVTSRTEIFDRFAKESLDPEELRQFREDLTVVKPSYDADALWRIVVSLASGRCQWFGKPECDAVVREALSGGALTTPLAVRDLVLATERVSNPTLLRLRVERRSHETAVAFAQELQACTPPTKLALLIIFLFGNLHQRKLIQIFDSVWPKQVEAFGPATFLEEIRLQLGHRIEHYGSRRTGLRFAHPAYQEAFVWVGMHDLMLEQLAADLLAATFELSPYRCSHAILRHVKRHPAYAQRLYDIVIALVHTHRDDAAAVAHVGATLVAAHGSMPSVGFERLLARLVSREEVAGLVNAASSIHLIEQLVRLAVNREYRVSGGDPSALAPMINWPHVLEVLRRPSGFSNALVALELCSRIRPSVVTEFTESLSRVDLRHRIAQVGLGQTRRLQSLVENPEIAALIEQWSDMEEAEPWRDLIGRLMAETTNRNAVVVDRGAVDAFRVGRALNVLPIGVSAVRGAFEEGDPIAVLDEEGERIGVGIAEYDADEIEEIRGHHSGMIAEILARYHGPAVVRRNTLRYVPGFRLKNEDSRGRQSH